VPTQHVAERISGKKLKQKRVVGRLSQTCSVHACPVLQYTHAHLLSTEQAIRLLAEWNGNIKDAVLNGEKGREWKKANLPISRSEVMPTLKTGKFVFAGYDKVGRAVCYYRVKLHDPKKFTALESVRAVVYNYEQMLAEGKLRGAGEICVVVDRTDAKSSNMDIEVREACWECGGVTRERRRTKKVKRGNILFA